MSAAQLKDIEAADKFVQSLAAKAEVTHPYPLWRGWALREAYRSGLEAGRKEQREVIK